MEMFLNAAQLKMVHVPYQGGFCVQRCLTASPNRLSAL